MAMTEQEWLACTDPQPMLEFLRGRTSDRKLRLFACACARSLWSGLVETEYKNAVAVAELCADGHGGIKELRGAWYDIWCLGWGTIYSDGDAAAAVWAAVNDFSGEAAEMAISQLSSRTAPLVREILVIRSILAR
jgi:hypothetical protein